MKVHNVIASLASVVFVAAGCAEDDRSGMGLELPEGDVAAGKAAFLDLGCVKCHSVRGEPDLPAPEEPVKMELGGELIHVRTYGQLVTAIIHPSHSVSRQAPKEVRESGISPMQSFNDVMTVDQMIDLVAFLHSKYVELKPGYNPVPF